MKGWNGDGIGEGAARKLKFLQRIKLLYKNTV
jgi:hypothetical protein